MKPHKIIRRARKRVWKHSLTMIGSVFRTIGFFIFFAGDSDRSKTELNDILDNHYLHRGVIYILIMLFIGLFLVVSLGPFVSQNLSRYPTTFNVSAVTEAVNITTHDVPMSRWPVNNVKLSVDCPDDKESVKYQKFTGSISLNPSVHVSFTRIAFGTFSVAMYSSNTSVGDLFDEEDEYIESLTNCAFFHISNIKELAESGKTIVLPITGDITVGNKIRFLTQNKTPVLRKGQITILDRTFIIGENYSVAPFKLEAGDSFEIKQPTVPSQGFVLINEKPAINLVYRAKGFKGIIKRYQSEDYELRNSYWSKLYHDEILSLSWISIIVLFNVIRIYLRFLVN